MRCKACNCALKGVSFNKGTKKWTEYCRSCSSPYWNTRSNVKSINEYPPKIKGYEWDVATRGPRPACLDWTDTEILESLCRNLGLMDDFDTLRNLLTEDNGADNYDTAATPTADVDAPRLQEVRVK